MTHAPLADTHGACWIERWRPTAAAQLPVSDARVAGMRTAARAMSDILERNAALPGLPEVRLRSTWQVVGHPRSTPWTRQGFHLVLLNHPRQVEGAGNCDVPPGADRVDPRAAVVVQTNSVRSTLTQQISYVREDQIEAFIEPGQIGKVGWYPVYRGPWIVVTFDGRAPWVPVATEEYPAFEERRLTTEAAEAD